jgi:hypothetical protein
VPNPPPEVFHLKGGIHKYLEEFGNDGLWLGRNFVFDARGAATPMETKLGRDEQSRCGYNRVVGDSTTTMDEISECPATTRTSSSTSSQKECYQHDGSIVVGACLYCQAPYDIFHPPCVCTVCREPVLVCDACRGQPMEFHCRIHFHLRHCYFTNLHVFSLAQLQQQLQELETQHLSKIRVGKQFKQKRKTLFKQCDKLRRRIDELQSGMNQEQAVAVATATPWPDDEAKQSFADPPKLKCRNCWNEDCTGSCWGFYGVGRKDRIKPKQYSSSRAEKHQEVHQL